MNTAPQLRCRACAATYATSRKTPWCDCGGLLDVDFRPENLEINGNEFSFWRYKGILPVRDRISLGEPITPIVPIVIRGHEIHAKLEYLLPTGSFKDRGAAILISAMKD